MVSGTCTTEAFARDVALKNVSGTVEDEEETNLVPLGIVIGLSASIIINVAQNCIARGWFVSFWTAAFAIACASNFIAFSFAPGSVLSPLEGAQFVTNLLFHLINGNAAILYPTRAKMEARKAQNKMAGIKYDPIADGPSYAFCNPQRIKPYGWKVIAGTVFVLGGVVLPVLGGAGATAPVFDEDAVQCFWEQRTSIIYHASLASVALVALVLWLLWRKPGPSDQQKKVDLLMVQYLWRSNGCDTKEGLKRGAKEVAEYKAESKKEYVDQSAVNLLLFATFSAIVGGFAVIQAKAISELVEILIMEGTDILTRRLVWITTGLVVGLFVTWLNLLKAAPELYSGVSAIPVMQGGYIIFASIGPGVHLEELQQLENTNLVLFITGMVCILVGISMMASGADPDKPYFAPTFWRDPEGLVLNEHGEWEPDQSTELPRGLRSFTKPENKKEYEAAQEAFKKYQEIFENDKRYKKLPDTKPVVATPWWKAPGTTKNDRETLAIRRQEDDEEKTAAAIEIAKQRRADIEKNRAKVRESKSGSDPGVLLPLLVFNNA